MRRLTHSALAALLLTCSGTSPAQQAVKPLPPQGIAIKPEVRELLRAWVGDLEDQIERIDPSQGDSRPHIEVLVRAVRLALQQNLFFKPSDPDAAVKLLDEAERRLHALASGARGLKLLGWRESADSGQPQLLVGGFRSRIDDSVQPYGLVVPAGYRGDEDRCRVDVWLHGRGETKTEVPFLTERMTNVGVYAPQDTFVLHPFGRYCNAFKFAGETDVYEALDHLGTLIAVDPDRIVIRGFSMGGAGCWHLAVHDPGRWVAANPGAGFVDTIVYQGWTAETPFPIDPTRKQLLRWYDVLPWVGNLRNTHTIAYSGEVDKQKQAADRVVEVAEELDVDVFHVVGEGMGHKIDPESAAKIDIVISAWADHATDPLMRGTMRKKIDFVTHTLRYNRVDWLSITGLRQHWSPGRVRAAIDNDDRIEIQTDGVTRLKLDFSESGWPHKPVRAELKIDGQTLRIDDWHRDPGIQCELEREGRWSVVEEIDNSLRKRPGLQGPIDDAFCDRFIFVAPSRPATHGVVQRWIDREFEYAKRRWSRLMRGDVRVVLDTEITQDQINSCHLVCFGDLTSNQYLRSIAPQLPIQWTREEIKVGNRQFDPSVHAAVLCYPNPRNPDRYLVINSGMTFRDFSNVSNSRQIAMLPDWAVLDVNEQDDQIFPGKIVADGFFDEQWSLKP